MTEEIKKPIEKLTFFTVSHPPNHDPSTDTHYQTTSKIVDKINEIIEYVNWMKSNGELQYAEIWSDPDIPKHYIYNEKGDRKLCSCSLIKTLQQKINGEWRNIPIVIEESECQKNQDDLAPEEVRDDLFAKT